MRRGVTVLAATFLLLLASQPASASVGSWSSWSSYTYVSVGSTECSAASRTTNGVEDAWPGCRVASHVRWRYRYSAGNFYEKDYETRSTGAFDLYEVVVDATASYNGVSVYTLGRVTCSGHSLGYSIDITFCGTENEGGGTSGYLRYGASYKVAFAWSGNPLQAYHWVRERVYDDGLPCCVTGA